MRLVGIDEAGRGPVLGPLVMAVVVLLPEHERDLAAAGVRDSKTFGSGPKAMKVRKDLNTIIKGACVAWEIVSFDADVVDSYVERGGLDDLEREGVEKLLERVGVQHDDRVVCDGEPIFGRLTRRWPNLLAENRADAHHVSVAAASVIAKTRRDEAMDEILRRYEPEFGRIAGGGYVNDGTRRFLEAYEARHGSLPPEARKSWRWRRPVDQPDITALLRGE